MATKTMGQRLPVWAVALLVGALVALVAAAAVNLGGTAQAQVGTLAEDADLKVTKTVKPKFVKVGSQQTFKIVVTNERGATARGVVLTDPLPKQVNFVKAQTSRRVPGSCGKNGRVVTCDLGDLRRGNSVTVKIFVKPVDPGSYKNTAYVEHRTAELQSGDNSDRATARAGRR